MPCAVVAFGGVFGASRAPRQRRRLALGMQGVSLQLSDFPNFFNFQKVVFCLQKYNF